MSSVAAIAAGGGLHPSVEMETHVSAPTRTAGWDAVASAIATAEAQRQHSANATSIEVHHSTDHGDGAAGVELAPAVHTHKVRALMDDGTRYGWHIQEVTSAEPGEETAGRPGAVPDAPLPGELPEVTLPGELPDFLQVMIDRSTQAPVVPWGEGYNAGMKRCLIALLSSRGWTLTADIAAKIESGDGAALAAWFQAALAAGSPRDVFG